MMLRACLYAFAILALLVVIFIVVVSAGVGLYGIAIVRSDAFGLFVTSYILVSIPAALIAAIWLARRR